jgi:ankyrin repeat protein
MHPLLRATQSIVHRLLQKQAEDRYQSCQGLIHDLRAVLQALALHESTLAAVASGACAPASAPATGSRQPPTDQLISLCALAARGDLDGVKAALDAESDLLNSVDYDLRTPLHLAASEGQIEVVRFLLSHPALRINPVDRWGSTPYSDAMRGGHRQVAEMLLAALETQDAAPNVPSRLFPRPAPLSSAGIIALTEFEAGKVDRASTFRLSQKLYGREREVEQLRQAYARVTQPSGPHGSAAGAPVAPQLVLISGYSGVVSGASAHI